MPPKRRAKREQPLRVSDDEDSSSESSSPPRLMLSPRNAFAMREGVAHFAHMPTDAVLSQIVGIATRLSATIAQLKYSRVSGDVRICKDCIRVAHSAASAVSKAVADLLALEVVLEGHVDHAEACLAEATAQAQQQPRRRRSN